MVSLIGKISLDRDVGQLGDVRLILSLSAAAVVVSLKAAGRLLGGFPPPFIICMGRPLVRENSLLYCKWLVYSLNGRSQPTVLYWFDDIQIVHICGWALKDHCMRV